MLTNSFYIETYILHFSSWYPLPWTITIQLHHLIESNQFHHVNFGIFCYTLRILGPVPVFQNLFRKTSDYYSLGSISPLCNSFPLQQCFRNRQSNVLCFNYKCIHIFLFIKHSIVTWIACKLSTVRQCFNLYAYL